MPRAIYDSCAGWSKNSSRAVQYIVVDLLEGPGSSAGSTVYHHVKYTVIDKYGHTLGPLYGIFMLHKTTWSCQ